MPTLKGVRLASGQTADVTWAGERITANAHSAYREEGTGDKAIRTFSGVSPRDIRERGVLGGDNSEARKIARALGIEGLF